jgi:prepilin-type processing-associated H-X9-DG protein
MATYLDEYGDGRWFPYPTGRGLDPHGFNGAEWLASLYWTRVVRDPGVFICPSSADSNDDGLDLGKDRAIQGRFGPGTVSYAGMHYSSLGDGVAIPADYPPNKPMASDDTEGRIHHRGGLMCSEGMNVLFFDSHVEDRSFVDLEHAVGQAGGLLEQLRN